MDEKYLEFALTERQVEVLTAYINAGGNATKASKSLGVVKGTVTNIVNRIKKRAALQGYDPDNGLNTPVREPHYVKGTSTLYNKQTGEPILQWVKTATNHDALREIAEVLSQELAKEAQPLKPIQVPQDADESLLSVYPIADAHLGLYVAPDASEKPTNTLLSQESIQDGIDYLVEASPASKYAIIANLGDFFHADNLDRETRRSKHRLKVDGDWHEILRSGLQTLEYVITRVLEKHEHVTLFNAIGNHDDHSSYMLSVALESRYRDEPRITIPLDYSPHYYYRHGLNLIGIHHGHTTKPQDLLGEMANTMSSDWGETKYRFWYTGHIHQQKVWEFPGVVVEAFRSISPRGSYAREHGWHSLQEMSVIVLDKEKGPRQRAFVIL